MHTPVYIGHRSEDRRLIAGDGCTNHIIGAGKGLAISRDATDGVGVLCAALGRSIGKGEAGGVAQRQPTVGQLAKYSVFDRSRHLVPGDLDAASRIGAAIQLRHCILPDLNGQRSDHLSSGILGVDVVCTGLKGLDGTGLLIVRETGRCTDQLQLLCLIGQPNLWNDYFCCSRDHHQVGDPLLVPITPENRGGLTASRFCHHFVHALGGSQAVFIVANLAVVDSGMYLVHCPGNSGTACPGVSGIGQPAGGIGPFEIGLYLFICDPLLIDIADYKYVVKVGAAADIILCHARAVHPQIGLGFVVICSSHCDQAKILHAQGAFKFRFHLAELIIVGIGAHIFVGLALQPEHEAPSCRIMSGRDFCVHRL